MLLHSAVGGGGVRFLNPPAIGEGLDRGVQPQKPKKPKISLKSHFGCWVFLGFLGFNWIFLRTFKKNVMKVFLPTVMLL